LEDENKELLDGGTECPAGHYCEGSSTSLLPDKNCVTDPKEGYYCSKSSLSA
jgi:hypothetical protein